MDLQKYRDVIKKKVCEHCIDYGEDGHCHLTADQECGVEKYLTELIDIVKNVQSPKLEDYITALRERICSQCHNQNEQGKCPLRRNVECALDRYLPMIIEAIEEVEPTKDQ